MHCAGSVRPSTLLRVQVPLLLVLAGGACAAPARFDWDATRAELARRCAEEQALRQGLMTGDIDQATAERLAEVDAANRAWLKDLVAAQGWPLISQVGAEGAQQAWLLAQHADPDVDFQEECLGLMRAAVAAHEAEPKCLAYLEDRVAVNRGRPQIYGTQFFAVDGEMVPRPIADPDHVDERRAAVGLDSLADYAAVIRGLRQKK